MSDNRIESEEYQGLDEAVPAGAAPAFGDVAAQSDYRDAEFQIPENDMPPLRQPCSSGDCGNPTAHPAETGWQQLISAVPTAYQHLRLRPRTNGMAYPSADDFRTAVRSLRPERPEEHAIQRIRIGWQEEVADRLADWPERIKASLSHLSEGWRGADFEAFEEVCTETRTLIDDIVADVDATATELQTKEDAIYALQGGDSGEVPYPAPMFWIDGEWHSWKSAHIRPAWWHGDCIKYTCEDAEHVVALAGADPALATEIIDYIDERVEYYIEYYEHPANIERDGLDPKGITVEVARELAVADASEAYGGTVEQNQTRYAARHQDLDDDIVQRGGDTDSEMHSTRTTSSDKPYPSVADPAHMDLDPPAMEQPSGTSSPSTSHDPTLEPPTNDGGGGEGEDDSTWSIDRPDSDEEDDDRRGGLAGLGPGGGPGGGLGGGLGGAGGYGPGALGGASVGAGATGGVGGGAAMPAGGVPGGAAGAGGRMGGGMMMGGMGGAGAGGMKPDEGERDPDVDLVEDENVWGFVSPDDDPYA